MSVISRYDSRTGVQRVVRAIAGQLSGLMRDDVDIVPVSGDGPDGYRAIGRNIDDLASGSSGDHHPIAPRSGDIFLGLDLAVRHLPKCEAHFVQWKRDGLRIYLLVHDLLPLVNRRWFRWRTRRNFRRWLQFLSRVVDGAICVSDETADALRAWLERNAPHRAHVVQTHVIPLSHDITGSNPSTSMPPDAAAILAWMTAVPTVLMVGTIEPRKGYDVALKAFSRIWRTSASPINLLIVGQPGWKTQWLQALMRRLMRTRASFRWLADVSDEFLVLLYQRSVGLLVCSRAEGYGLPIIEAINLGTPVLARDIPVFRRLFESSISYFGQDDPVSLGQEIREFVELSRSKRDGDDTAVKLPKSGSWEDVTNAMLAYIERDSGSVLRC